MTVLQSPSREQLLHHVFDQQPTPLIVLSNHSTIVLANLACEELFPSIQNPVDKCISQLPLTWQDGSKDALIDILTANIDYSSKPHKPSSEHAQDTPKLRVEISKEVQNTITSARLLVTDITFDGCQYRLLSFENISENYTAFWDSNGGHNDHVLVEPARPKAVHFERTYTGTHGSTTTTQDTLDARFAQLRDAIYFNARNRSGFLLSADETFCFPNYQGAKNVTPLELDDVELYFQDWDIWDEHFTRKLPVTEYPSLWLSRNRIPFEKKRYGLKEHGKRLVLEATGEPLFDHLSGDFVGNVIWIESIGEYDEVVAQDLKADLADFRAMCDRLPHILWTMDNKGQADYFSKSWYTFTGLNEEQSVGLSYTSVIDEGDMKNAWAKFADASEKKTECLFEARYRRHDGQWLWMSVRSKPLLDSDGNVLKWYGSSTNVDSIMLERINAEKQRSQMMEMLLLADVGLFEVSNTWRLTMLEGRMHWMDQQSVSDLLTKLDMVEDGAPTLKARLQGVMAGQQQFAVLEEKIGSRWYKFRLVADTENSEAGEHRNRKVLGCSVDITEQRMNAALESENARLAHEASLEVERSRLKSAFLAHMSHEIRTPIAGIIGTASLLAETRLDDEQYDAINDIQNLGNNLLGIVNDVLDFSKIEAGKMAFAMTKYDIHAVVSQVRKSFDHATRGRSIEITCQQDLSIPLHMVGDSGKVRQILTNLVGNAVKFTSSGSVDLSVETIGDQIRLSVKDTGVGIDKQTLSTLFKPFVQGDASTARRFGGTGLGLTISREYAEKMGGTLSLASVPLEGTEAILILPKEMIATEETQPENLNTADDRLVSESQAPTALNSPLGGTVPSEQLVLVVEDNAINQKVALNLVRKLGYRAEAVWNGQEALDHIEKRDTDLPSLILMDCQMPLLDGYEATKALRTNTKYEKAWSIPIIALTASAIQGDKEKCYKAGMDLYLTKPINKRTLQSALDQFSWKGGLRRPSVAIAT